MRVGTGVLTGLLLLQLILAAGQASPPPGPPQAADPTDPLSLFAKTMPVFTHARCANCHGATDPTQNLNHGGGLVDPASQSCMDGGCHTASSDWKLATNFFVRQTTRELCEFMAKTVIPIRTPAGFMTHLRDDELIKLAFVGLMGDASTTGVPARPGMTHDKFREAAQAWIDDGLALCDRDGGITYTEEIASNETSHTGPNHETLVQQNGRRTVTVELVNGRYEFRVQVTGSVTIVQTMRADVNGVPCQVVITSTTDYADVDDQARTDAGISGRARVNVQFQPGGRYMVTVQLPEEKHRQEDHGSLRDGCGTGLQPSPRNTQDMVWPATSFVFRGQLPDPSTRTQLIGKEVRTWKARVSPDEDPWLPDHYAAAALDGSFHPVKVTIKWNFRYR